MASTEELFAAALQAAEKFDGKEKSPRYLVGDHVITYAPGFSGHGLPGRVIEVSKRRNGTFRYLVKTFPHGKYNSEAEYFVEEDKIAPRLITPEAASRIQTETKYEKTTDRKGNPLHPGDRVRVKRYPRGTVEGTVVLSPTKRVVLKDGSTVRALSVLDERDGTHYNLTVSGSLKLESK